jgi:DinB superfamily
MRTIENLLADLDANTDALIEQIINFDPRLFHQQTSAESWSAAQLTEHLYVFDKLVYHLITGETEPAHRAADEKVSLIQAAMNNRSRSIVAPDPIVPLGKNKDQQVLITKIITTRKDSYKVIQNADLSLLCLGFTHKGFGPMTRLEWIVFMMAHAQRHFHQFKKIATTLHSLR